MKYCNDCEILKKNDWCDMHLNYEHEMNHINGYDVFVQCIHNQPERSKREDSQDKIEINWINFSDQLPHNEQKILILFKNEDVWTGIFFDDYIAPKENGCQNILCEKIKIDHRGDMKWIPIKNILPSGMRCSELHGNMESDK